MKKNKKIRYIVHMGRIRVTKAKADEGDKQIRDIRMGRNDYYDGNAIELDMGRHATTHASKTCQRILVNVFC